MKLFSKDFYFPKTQVFRINTFPHRIRKSIHVHYIYIFLNFQVLGGIDGKRVLVTLGQGSVFGEIALLGVGGMNRRTADVVSRGFSNLFVLQKNDLEMVLKDYEDAKRILNTRARKLMKENEERVAMEFKEHQKYLLEQELKGRQPITDVSTMYILTNILSKKIWIGTLL